jgi:hypothetical protein
MTRNEAKILAEELYKLMKKDIKNLVSQAVTEETDEWLTPEQAAGILSMSISYVMHSDIPYTKVGHRRRYRKSDIIKILER